MGGYSPFALVNTGWVFVVILLTIFAPGFLLGMLHTGVGGVTAGAHVLAYRVTGSPARVAMGSAWSRIRNSGAEDARAHAQDQLAAARARIAAERQRQREQRDARRAA